MTQEEKARAYDEALERAKMILCNIPEGSASVRDIETIFPQLRESEDERIRKFLITIVNNLSAPNFKEAERKDVLAWLEKQKINIEGDFGRGYDCGYEACLNSHGAEWFEKQKEQKPAEKEITLTDFEEVLNTFLFDFANSSLEDCEPKEYIKKHSAKILKAAYKELNAKLQQDIFEARQEGVRDGYEVAKAEQQPAEWSDEDEKILRAIEWHVGQLDVGETINGFSGSDMLRVLKSIRPQPKQEWSEEDEEMLNSCISSIEEAKENRYAYKETDGDTSYDHEIAWLKSLRPQGSKDSLQTHWKPSEEQMEALIDCTIGNEYDVHALVRLWAELKKL